MNFWTRLGWSLLLFGALALAASFFGYAPRKLAQLSPGQVKAAAVALMAMGAVCLVLGGDPRTRRKVLLGLGWVGGLAAVALAGLFVLGYFVSKRRLGPPPAPEPPSASAPARVSGAPSPAAAPAANPMAALHQKRGAWEARFGRGRVWTVVVHLGGAEPPAEFEARLRRLVAGKDGGEIVVARMGGLLQAGLAPCEDAGALRVALEGLFPGARVQLAEGSRQATVFASAPAGPPR